MQNRVERAVKPNAPPIQTEVVIFKTEVAKSASHRSLVHAGTACNLDARAHPIKEWIIQLPKAMAGNSKDGLNRIVARLQQLLQRKRDDGFGPARRRAVKSCQSAHSFAARIPNTRLDANRAGFPVWNDVKILDANHRRQQEFHGSGNAAGVIRVVTWHRIIAASGCYFFQPNTVNQLMSRIEDSDSNLIRLVGPDGGSRIQYEGFFSTFVNTETRSVDPHLGKVIHCVKAEQISPPRKGMSRSLKLTPIPRDAMVVGKGVLDYPGHSRWGRAIRGSLGPPSAAAAVIGIERQEPVRTI